MKLHIKVEKGKKAKIISIQMRKIIDIEPYLCRKIDNLELLLSISYKYELFACLRSPPLITIAYSFDRDKVLQILDKTVQHSDRIPERILGRKKNSRRQNSMANNSFGREQTSLIHFTFYACFAGVCL